MRLTDEHEQEIVAWLAGKEHLPYTRDVRALLGEVEALRQELDQARAALERVTVELKLVESAEEDTLAFIFEEMEIEWAELYVAGVRVVGGLREEIEEKAAAMRGVLQGAVAA